MLSTLKANTCSAKRISVSATPWGSLLLVCLVCRKSWIKCGTPSHNITNWRKGGPSSVYEAGSGSHNLEAQGIFPPFTLWLGRACPRHNLE
ncbi:hypothetical protein MATL_G00103360 [Megalops atlanticus]|uniref:Uncharacterized protein n=1 Tax=Megalops atlanticus TaxID=7932 RepID=A0A9D3TDE0_MEGAT|nr:hypothetical protein MATL_G00103360 [Megalops atlanticus]